MHERRSFIFQVHLVRYNTKTHKISTHTFFCMNGKFFVSYGKGHARYQCLVSWIRKDDKRAATEYVWLVDWVDVKMGISDVK